MCDVLGRSMNRHTAPGNASIAQRETGGGDAAYTASSVEHGGGQVAIGVPATAVRQALPWGSEREIRDLALRSAWPEVCVIGAGRPVFESEE